VAQCFGILGNSSTVCNGFAMVTVNVYHQTNACATMDGLVRHAQLQDATESFQLTRTLFQSSKWKDSQCDVAQCFGILAL